VKETVMSDPLVGDARPSRAERTRLLLEAAAGTRSEPEKADVDAQVIELNMPVAVEIASRYRARGVPDDDLRQVAYLALVKAVQRYEYGPERPFLAYAVPTIRGEIRRHFRDLGWTIRPTRTIQVAQARIRQAEDDLCQRLGRSPRPSELAEHLDLDLDVVIEALAGAGLYQPTSLDSTPVDEGSPLSSRLAEQDEGYATVDTRLVLAGLLDSLTPRERTMIDLRFFHDKTQKEIGEVLGVTQMQVSRLMSALMARLRDQLTETETTSALPETA
jgi:RNA polymerase sigma-B factor